MFYQMTLEASAAVRMELADEEEDQLVVEVEQAVQLVLEGVWVQVLLEDVMVDLLVEDVLEVVLVYEKEVELCVSLKESLDGELESLELDDEKEQWVLGGELEQLELKEVSWEQVLYGVSHEEYCGRFGGGLELVEVVGVEDG